MIMIDQILINNWKFLFFFTAKRKSQNVIALSACEKLNWEEKSNWCDDAKL